MLCVELLLLKRVESPVFLKEGMLIRSQVLPRLTALSSFSPDATYVITGGSGGIARVMTEWLAEQGAKHILLASRAVTANEPTRNLIEKLRGRGSNVVYRKCDMGIKKDVDMLVKETAMTSAPIRGVIHGAMDNRVGSSNLRVPNSY